MHSTNANCKCANDDDDDDNNNNRIKMASHTMQLAGKRKILHILKETKTALKVTKTPVIHTSQAS
jgi:hypothetical protein